MGRISKPNVPYVEAHLKGGRQRPSLIVIHSSFTTSDKGAALAMANTMHRSDARESVHYLVDEATVIECLDSKWVANHRESPKNTIGVKLADDPSGLFSRWRDKSHKGLMSNAAQLVAELCLYYKIPPRFITQQELSKWQKLRLRRRGGIITDGFLGTVTWPEQLFIELVEDNIARIRSNNK